MDSSMAINIKSTGYFELGNYIIGGLTALFPTPSPSLTTCWMIMASCILQLMNDISVQSKAIIFKFYLVSGEIEMNPLGYFEPGNFLVGLHHCCIPKIFSLMQNLS